MNALRRGRGFTLIELLIVTALLSVLMVLGAPNFMQYRRNADLSDAVSNLVMAAGNAKSAALKSGRNAIVQVRNAGTGWTSGWIVFVDTNWNNAYDAGTDELVMSHDALSNDLSATPAAGTTLAAGYLLFNAGGFPRTKTSTETNTPNGSLTLATTGRSTNVIVDNSGRLRTCKVGTTGCAAL